MAPLLERIAERLRSGLPLLDMAGDALDEKPSLPASAEQIDAAEAALGFALPELLREIYLQVGNGGFGPGYGLLGISGGATDDRDRTVEQVYATFRRTNPGLPSPWPERLLPICYQGCGIYDCLDCSKPHGQIYYYEPNIPGDGPHGCVLEPHFGSLEEWLSEWLREDDPFKRVSKTVDLGGKKPRAFDHTPCFLRSVRVAASWDHRDIRSSASAIMKTAAANAAARQPASHGARCDTKKHTALSILRTGPTAIRRSAG